MTTVKSEPQVDEHRRVGTPWGHVLGIGAFFIIVAFVPPWAEPFTAPKVIALSVSSFAVIPLIWLRRQALLANRFPLLLLVGFVAMALLSQLLSGAPQAVSLWGEWSRRSGTLTVISLAVLLVASSVLTRSEIRTTLAWLVWAGVPATAYGLVQLVGADPLAWSDQGWIVSTFGNPNFAAAGLSMLALLTAGLALTQTFGVHWRVLMAPLAALEALLALQTGSSQAIFALAAGIGAGVIVWLLRWDSSRRLAALIAVGAVGAVGFLLTLMALLGSGPLVSVVSTDTLMFRQWYWGAAISMARSHPLFGVGPDGYGRFYGEYRSEEAAEMFTLGATAAHDVPLQWAATLGIPAALLYVALMITVAVVVVRRLWVQGYSASPIAIPLLAMWAAYQVQSLVSIDATEIAMFGWLSTGLLFAVTLPHRESAHTPRGSWIAAAVLAAVAAIAWMPALMASNESKAVVQGTTEEDVYRAISLVQSTTLPCQPSTEVAQWMIQVAPAEQTVNGVFAGAEADNRCYGLVNAPADFAVQLEDADRALALSEQAVAIDPLNYSTWLLLARAEHLAGNDAAAQAAIDRSATLAPSSAEPGLLAEQLGLVVPLPPQ